MSDSRIGAKPLPGGTPTASSGAPLSDVLRKGSQGDAVEELQHLLNGWGLDAGPVDGKMGDKTVAAVKKYQAGANIPADGQVGPETKKAMLADLDGGRPFKPQEDALMVRGRQLKSVEQVIMDYPLPPK